MSDERLSHQERFRLLVGDRDSDCRYVDPPEFVALATSTRKLIRADQSKAGLLGLLDLVTGERVFIDRDELSQAEAVGRANTASWSPSPGGQLRMKATGPANRPRVCLGLASGVRIPALATRYPVAAGGAIIRQL